MPGGKMSPFEKGEAKWPLPSLLLPAGSAMNFRNPGGANRQTGIEPNVSAAREAELAPEWPQIQKLAARPCAAATPPSTNGASVDRRRKR